MPTNGNHDERLAGWIARASECAEFERALAGGFVARRRVAPWLTRAATPLAAAAALLFALQTPAGAPRETRRVVHHGASWGIVFPLAEYHFCEIGDADCNGCVDLRDVEALCLAIGNAATFTTHYPHCDPTCGGDMNGDGMVSLADLPPLLAALP